VKAGITGSDIAKSPKKTLDERQRQLRIIRALAAHLWPSKEMAPDANSLKARYDDKMMMR